MSTSVTLEDIWALFRETDRKFQESREEAERRSRELDQRFQESREEAERRSRELDQRFQESRQEAERRSRELKLLFQETDRKFQETDRKFQETAREITRVGQKIDKLGSRLGDFAVEMVKPAVVRLFQARGLDVHEVHSEVSVQRHNEGIEIDLLVVNDAEAVVVEVKSKLTVADVDEHLERLAKFKRLLPRYADVRALGAVAAMVVPEDVARYAYRQGLFVLAQSGETVVILNDGKFQPRTW
jgi:hypothetical protein